MPAGTHYTLEQIIGKLHEAELEIANGLMASQATKNIGVTEQTYYHWRKDHGGL